MILKTLHTPSIKTKLTGLGLSLLIIPWLGYQYVQEIRDFLIHSQQDAQLLAAKGVATILSNRPELFHETTGVQRPIGEQANLHYAHALENVIQLDGQIADWGSILDQSTYHTGNSDFTCGAGDDLDNFSLSTVAGYSENDLYFLFDVTDNNVIYRDPELVSLDTSDQIRMLIQRPGGQLHYYLLVAVKAHSRMSIYEVDDSWKTPLLGGKPITRYIAEIAQTKWGYRIELRMPRDEIGKDTAIGYFVIDVDNEDTRHIVSMISTSPRQANRAGQIRLDSPELRKILQGLDHPQSRISILDTQQRVRAIVGGLSSSLEDAQAITESTFFARQLLHIQYFLDWLLRRPSEQFRDIGRDMGIREGPVFSRLVGGEPLVYARPSLDQMAQIIVAGYPIRSGEETLGAVILEQSSNAIMAEQYALLRNLTLVTLLVFAFVMTALVVFTWRITARIRKLYSTTEKAITQEGRVIENRIPNQIYPQDELGDLGRSITSMLTRLSVYTRYLEGMPDTLAHELNNPLNVVSSSLERMGTELPEIADNKYMQRAQNGVSRLRSILTNLTEAVNLEDAMRSEAKEKLDLAVLVEEVVEGYHYSYQNHTFQLEVKTVPLWIEGNADHLAQMLDKLVDNAVQYTPPNRPIVIRVREQGGEAEIMVLNEGPTIPNRICKHVFDPMVSYGKTNAKQSHLGLGLFVVRLISEYHHGKASIENRSDVDGVGVTVSIPKAA